MTDNSDLVLRWEIDNATARAATGRMESGEFNEGGFKWIAAAERTVGQPNNHVDFTLRCDSDHSRLWKCDAEVRVHILNINATLCPWGEKVRFCFDDNNHSCLYNANWWSNFTHEIYNINDKVTMEFRIHIISSDGGQPISSMFAAPNSMSNVILKIGDEKLYVSKDILAAHSPVFETLFFGEFAEKGKEEVEIKDVVYKEFLDLLNLLYCQKLEITDRTVPHILKLADQFAMERFIEHSVKHLIQSKGFDVVKKLSFADQYRLISLRDQCFKSFTNAADMIAKLKSASEFDNFSDKMKVAICERIVKF